MTTAQTEIQRVILWAAIEDVPALWSLVDEVQALVPDRAEAATQAQAAATQLVQDKALTVVTAPDVEGDTTPVGDHAEAQDLVSDPRWWRIPDTYDEPVVRVEVTPIGEWRYQQLVSG